MIEIVAIGAGVTVLWAGFGVLAYGLSMGHFTREFYKLYEPNLYCLGISTEEEVRRQWRTQRFFSGFMALLGPAGALVCYLCGGFNKYGLRFRR